MRYSVIINTVKRKRICHVVSGVAPEEELPSAAIELEKEKAATGPPILPHHNKQHLGGAQLKRLPEETGYL